MTLSVLAESGIDASGLVVDGDVFAAAEKVREDEDVHEIVLATYPTGRSRWMGDDIVDRLRKATGLGITRVVVLPEDARRPVERPGVTRVAVIADDALGADGLVSTLRERADRQALAVTLPQMKQRYNLHEGRVGRLEMSFGLAFAAGVGNVLNNALCILFAYWTNRTFVFKSRAHGRAAWGEFGKFVSCRILTAVVDQLIMFGGVTLLGPSIGFMSAALWANLVKLFSQIVVIVSNYVFSKVLIFAKK